MTKTYMSVLKNDALIMVPFTTVDVSALQSILIRHINGEATLDEVSWKTIETFCTRIDDCAADQHQMESKEVEF